MRGQNSRRSWPNAEPGARSRAIARRSRGATAARGGPHRRLRCDLQRASVDHRSEKESQLGGSSTLCRNAARDGLAIDLRIHSGAFVAAITIALPSRSVLAKGRSIHSSLPSRVSCRISGLPRRNDAQLRAGLSRLAILSSATEPARRQARATVEFEKIGNKPF